jgi:hypothetical protein
MARELARKDRAEEQEDDMSLSRGNTARVSGGGGGGGGGHGPLLLTWVKGEVGSKVSLLPGSRLRSNMTVYSTPETLTDLWFRKAPKPTVFEIVLCNFT